MSQFIFIGDHLTMPVLRDYIITHKVNEGDSLILNQQDFQALIDHLKASEETFPDLPLTLLGVIIARDSSDSVPVGKIQIVNAEKPF